MFRPARVLVALDTVSSASDGDDVDGVRELLVAASEVATSLGAVLVLVRVAPAPDELGLSLARRATHAEVERRLAQEQRLARFVGAGGVTTELLEDSDPAAAIAAAAVELRAGLIVASAPSHGLVTRLLRGDVVRRLSLQTATPLLLVPIDESLSPAVEVLPATGAEVA